MKGEFFFFFGHWCSSQCNWQKSHFACTLLYKQSWCGWYTVLTHEGSAAHTHSPGELEDENHSPGKSWGLLPKSLQCSMGMESEELKKKEHQGENPVFTGQQIAARVTNSGQRRVVWQFQLLFIRQLAQAWPLSWNGGWVLCSIAFLCHRQYLCSWRVHYFFNEKGIFWRILSYIFEKENQYYMYFYICSLALKKKKKRKKSFTLSFG